MPTPRLQAKLQLAQTESHRRGGGRHAHARVCVPPVKVAGAWGPSISGAALIVPEGETRLRGSGGIIIIVHPRYGDPRGRDYVRCNAVNPEQPQRNAWPTLVTCARGVRSNAVNQRQPYRNP